jgi:tetratricopeptide (TPR) repeat protein
MITQAQTALAAKNWEAAEPLLKQMIAIDGTRYQFYQALGDAQANLNKYDEAVDSYGKGIELAQGVAPGTTPKDPKNPDSDPVKAKASEGQMLTAQGNAYLKLKKTPEAIAAYTKAAEISPNPGVAYFNICATQYNNANSEAAVASAIGACDKAIAADPNKADAYFIKGSLLMGAGKMDAQGKYIPPEGTADALNKYLQLDPNGAHAADVKQMLEMIGAKIETSYGTTKKKKP